MPTLSTARVRAYWVTAAIAVATTAAACAPGMPIPQIAAPPVSGTSGLTPGGGNIVNLVGCLPAGGVVTADVTRIDDGPAFNDTWMLQVRELGSNEATATFPWQQIIVEDGAAHETLVSDPIPAGSCVQILVQAPSYFDLPSPRFTYTVTW